jgi:thymidylate synthase (FAD)
MTDQPLRSLTSAIKRIRIMREIKVASAGFVRLVDTMPTAIAESTNLDSAIVQAARISTGQGTKDSIADRSLIRYLMRNKHTSPFEMVEFKFHLKMPIFVARQWMRHRMASINEYSGRYSEIPDTCWIPDPYDVRMQSKVNKQSSEPVVSYSEDAGEFSNQFKVIYDKAYKAYKRAVDRGIAREQARTILPQAMYTEFYWKIDLHNLLNFVRLRAEKHSQLEIQEYANAVYSLVKPLVPVACEAFEDYVVNSITLSKPEMNAIKNALKFCGIEDKLAVDCTSLGTTERLEFDVKINKLGMTAIKGQPKI